MSNENLNNEARIGLSLLNAGLDTDNPEKQLFRPHSEEYMNEHLKHSYPGRWHSEMCAEYGKGAVDNDDI